jgi:pyrimidine-specific ribonucleoside hydrolase
MARPWNPLLRRSATCRAILVVTMLAISACGVSGGATIGPGSATVAPTSATTLPAATPVLPDSRTLLVDTDVAPDDLVALSFLLHAPNVTVVAITVSGTGEAHCAGGVSVVLSLLERLGAPAIPVACGRATPLVGDHAFPDAWRGGADAGSGLAMTPTARVADDRSAVELIEAAATGNEGLSVLTLGPLTNLAEALESTPGLADQLGPVYVMGGALHVPGNLVGPGAPTGNAVAEWNVYVDPHAAQVVVDAGLDLSFVSLDGTNHVPVTPEFAQRAREAARQSAGDVLVRLFDANPFMAAGSYFLWDPLAAELAAGYPVGTFTAATITVEEAEGAESGFTRPTTGEPNIGFLSSADPGAAEDTLLAVLNAP